MGQQDLYTFQSQGRRDGSLGLHRTAHNSPSAISLAAGIGALSDFFLAQQINMVNTLDVGFLPLIVSNWMEVMGRNHMAFC